MWSFFSQTRSITLVLVALGLCGIAITALADAYPAPIRHLENQGVEIVDSFDSAGQLRLYIGRYQGRTMEIYTTADQEHAIIGTMIDGQGEQVASAQLRALAADAMDWNSLDQTHWIAEGDPNGERVVYAFMDPNCPYCGAFWKASREYVDQPGVQIRFIMVGMLRPTSEALAAGILAADNPVAALAQHERNREKNSPTEPTAVVQRFTQQVRENTAFMRNNNINATPTIVFKDSRGKVQLVQGVPSETLMQAEIFYP